MTVDSNPSPIALVLKEGKERGGEQTRNAKNIYLFRAELSNDNVP